MNFKRLTLGLSLAFTLGAAPAMAAPPQLGGQQIAVKNALNSFNLDLGQERLSVTRGGREDMVYQTLRNHDAVIADLKNAYQSERNLGNGMIVAGWAFIEARQSYTFTLSDLKTKNSYVAEVARDSMGARVTIKGITYAWRPQRAPLSQLPRRYSPVGRDTIAR